MKHDKVKSERRHRGQMAKAVITLGMVASLLVSCGKSEDDGGRNLVVMEWAGYEKPRYYPEYLAKYGKEPEYAIFSNADDAMQRMRLGFKVDLAHLCTGQMKEARDSGLIKPIDTSRIERWADITPELLELPDVRLDGEYFLVPWEWAFSTVSYNPELIDVENATYDIFIDPRFKGKTALPSDIGVNILIAGIIAGWVDPNDPTEEEMAEAPEIFSKMLENARFIWTDSTQLEQAWAAGDVAISYVYGSASMRMPKEGMPVTVVQPLMTWMCGLSISANGSASEDQSYDYINAMLDPASGVELFKEYNYGHANAKTVNFIDPAKIKETGIDDPVGSFERGLFTAALPPEKKSRLIQMWFEAQAGLN